MLINKGDSCEEKMKNKEAELKTNSSNKIKKKKGVLKKIAIGVTAVSLGYLSVSFSVVNLFNNKINDQVSDVVYNEYKNIEKITYSFENFSNYVDNYNYTEEMFQQDLKKLKTYDRWFVEKYRNFLKSKNLSDPASDEEINQRINNDGKSYLTKLIHFEQVFTDFYASDGGLSFTFYEQYLTYNDPEYIKLEEQEKNKYLRNKYEKIEYSKVLFLNNDSIKGLIKFKMYGHKNKLNNKANLYSYLNLLKMRRTSLDDLYQLKNKLPLNEQKKYEIFILELTKSLKNKDINEDQLYKEIYNFICKNIQRLQYDRDFQYETLKRMHVIQETSQKLEKMQNPMSKDNFDMVKKMIPFLYPQSHILNESLLSLPYDDFEKEVSRKEFAALYSGIIDEHNINKLENNENVEKTEMSKEDYFYFLK